jgi:GNAT superfamily N-acetyltransferase
LFAPLARLYLHENLPELEALLLSQGFCAKVEIGFLAFPVGELQPVEQISLRRVDSDTDWKTKLRIHFHEDVGSDGYQNQAEDWNEIMFRKCQTGFKQSFLIYYQGLAVGTIGIVEAPGIRRVKNLFVMPKYRGLGLAASAVRVLLRDASSRSIPTMGVFGIEGSSGCAVYQSCGFQPATRQVEYTKHLDRDRRSRIAPRNPR